MCSVAGSGVGFVVYGVCYGVMWFGVWPEWRSVACVVWPLCLAIPQRVFSVADMMM